MALEIGVKVLDDEAVPIRLDAAAALRRLSMVSGNSGVAVANRLLKMPRTGS